MKKVLLALSCAALMAGFGSTASSAATVLFNFTLSAPPVGAPTGSGIFTTSTTATAGTYLITGISGTYNGVSILGLLPVNTFPDPTVPPANDNLLFFPGPYLDLGGVSFQLTNLVKENIFYNSDPTFPPVGYFAGPGSNFLQTQLTVSPRAVGSTPEPASLILLGTGALGLFGAVRRRITA